MYKYEEIARAIEKSIADGTLKAYDQLPTVVELCEQYGVSKSTINQVINELSSRGLVTRRRGSGFFVKSYATEADYYWQGYNRIVNYTEDADHEPEIHTEVKEFTVVRPEPELAKILDIGTKDFVYWITRVLLDSITPFAIEYIYIPLDLAPGFKYDDAAGDIESFAEKRLGTKLNSTRQSIRAVMPTSEERGRLQVAYGIPLLEVERVDFMNDGRPFDCILSHYRADQYEYRTLDTL